MVAKILRGAAAIVAALVLAFVGIVAVELMSSVLHPFPQAVDPTDLEACRQHVARYPTGVLFLCAAGWWFTVFVSCWMATRMGTNRRSAHGIIVGVILLALAICNMAMLPYPGWFWINLLTFPACCASGIWLGRRRAEQKLSRDPE